MGRSVRGDSVSGRSETGDLIVTRSREIDTKPVKAKLAAFSAVHARHTKAEANVAAAREKVEAAQAAAAAIDTPLDADVQEMASLLPGIGLPRANPFKAFGLPPPSKLITEPWDREAKDAKTLAAKAAGHKKATPAIKALAKRIAAHATKLGVANQAIVTAGKREAEAITARNVVGVDWQRALERLKNATRAAEDDGASGIYEKLLGNPPERPKRGPRAKPSKATDSATASGASTNGAAASA